MPINSSPHISGRTSSSPVISGSKSLPHNGLAPDKPLGSHLSPGLEDTLFAALKDLFWEISTHRKKTGVVAPVNFINKVKKENGKTKEGKRTWCLILLFVLLKNSFALVCIRTLMNSSIIYWIRLPRMSKSIKTRNWVNQIGLMVVYIHRQVTVVIRIPVSLTKRKESNQIKPILLFLHIQIPPGQLGYTSYLKGYSPTKPNAWLVKRYESEETL